MSEKNKSGDTTIGLALSTIYRMREHEHPPSDEGTDVHECLSPEYERPPQRRMSHEMEALLVFVMFVCGIAAYAVASICDQAGGI